MANFKIKLTTAGKAALVDDANIGTEALKIRNIEIGSSFYDPTGSEENLKNLIKSLDTFGASPGKDGIIHISIRDEAEETYDVGEIGLRTGTGVLFAIISNAEGLITTKGLNDVLLISSDLAITEVDVSNVSFGPANFIYQPATEEKEGILEIATDDEMDAGEELKAVDAEKFQSALTRRSSSKVDLNDANKLATSAAIYALSQLIETNNNSINAINSLLQSDNADLDKLQEIVDYIETIKGTQDTLAISNIALLQDALDKKSDIHTHPYAAQGDVLTAVPENALFTDTNTWRSISDAVNSSSQSVSASSKAVNTAFNRAKVAFLDGGSLKGNYPDGWSSTRGLQGDYTLTHNLGTKEYVCLLTCRGGGSSVHTNVVSIDTKTANTVSMQVNAIGNGSNTVGATDSQVEVIIIPL